MRLCGLKHGFLSAESKKPAASHFLSFSCSYTLSLTRSRFDTNEVQEELAHAHTSNHKRTLRSSLTRTLAALSLKRKDSERGAGGGGG